MKVSKISELEKREDKQMTNNKEGQKDQSYPLSPERVASRLESITALEELIQELLKQIQDKHPSEAAKTSAQNYLSACQEFLALISHQLTQPTFCQATDTLVTIIFLVISSCILKPALPTILLPLINAIISKEESHDRS
ncbi:MAG TPA: hypothetical protein PKL04_10265 [Methanofastidiosum sp.]|nr:hypothetical protein [Methanofastidiosum sp.]